MRSENVDDRLSALPEDIVSQILSLMPTLSAVRTSILSKRWRHSWMHVTNLDLDNQPFPSISDMLTNPYLSDVNSVDESSNLTKYLDRVLEFCKSSQVKLFRLHLRYTTVPESSLSKWIDKAMRLNVQEVDIRLGMMNELPLNLLTCSKTLTKLRIDFYTSPNYSLCPVNLPCLKTLDIVVLIHRFMINVFKLVYGSPILECLSLEFIWLDGEEDFIFNIPTLKQLRLTLSCSEPISSFSHKVVLNVPNLEYLFVGGDLCSLFVMENVSSLVEASVSFHHIRVDHRWFELVKGLNQVKSFSVRNFDFIPSQNLVISRSSSWPIFLNMKHLELKGSYDFALIPQFVESSPQLKHLCIEKFDNLFLKKQDPEEYSWIEVIEPGWIELKSVPACMLKSLATIKFLKCRKQKWDMEFLKYMLGNAQVLKKVTVVPENLCIEEETRFCEELLKLPKASPHCEIQFLGSCSSSTD